MKQIDLRLNNDSIVVFFLHFSMYYDVCAYTFTGTVAHTAHATFTGALACYVLNGNVWSVLEEEIQTNVHVSVSKKTTSYKT